MSRTITEECVNCGACEPECPQEAISQGDDYYVIDPAKCDECEGKDSAACKDACPTDGAITP
jgi:ferredoxin